MIGSSKFKEDYIRESKRLTLEGNIVIPLIFYKADKEDGKIAEKNADVLNRICNAKIELCDTVFVVNPDNYIGPRTWETIAYANKLGKEIIYMED